MADTRIDPVTPLAGYVLHVDEAYDFSPIYLNFPVPRKCRKDIRDLLF